MMLDTSGSMDFLPLPAVDPLSVLDGKYRCTAILSSPQRFSRVQVQVPAATATSKLENVWYSLVLELYRQFCLLLGRIFALDLGWRNIHWNRHTWTFIDFSLWSIFQKIMRKAVVFGLNRLRKNEGTWIFLECAVCFSLTKTGLSFFIFYRIQSWRLKSKDYTSIYVVKLLIFRGRLIRSLTLSLNDFLVAPLLNYILYKSLHASYASVVAGFL